MAPIAQQKKKMKIMILGIMVDWFGLS